MSRSLPVPPPALGTASLDACRELARHLPSTAHLRRLLSALPEESWDVALLTLEPVAMPRAIQLLLLLIRQQLPRPAANGPRLLQLAGRCLDLCAGHIPHPLSFGLLAQLKTTAACLGLASGRPGHGRRDLAYAELLLAPTPDPLIHLEVTAVQALFAWAEHRPEDSLAAFRRAWCLARELDEPSWEVALCRALLWLLERSTPGDEADDYRARLDQLAHAAAAQPPLDLLALLDVAESVRHIC